MLEIYKLKREEEEVWDSYVLKSDQSTFYHQLGWRNVVEKTYKHKPIYLIAKEESEIKGVLPLFLMKCMFFGKKLVSVPFVPYGGVCADNKTIENALIEEAKRITKEFSADYLELRHYSNKGVDLPTISTYYNLLIKLDPDPEKLWKRFHTNVRNSTRKAIKYGLKSDIGKRYINDFCRVYSINMRDLGTPVHKFEFFKNALTEFAERSNILVVKRENEVIAALLFFYFKDIVVPGWASSIKEYKSMNPNNLLYWEIIKDGCEKGYSYYDFGRSQANSGNFNFKKKWGAEARQLHYQYYLYKGDKILDLSFSNPRRKMFAKFWRKLPIPIANILGSKIRENFP